MSQAALVVDDGARLITTWNAPATYAGSASSVRLFVDNPNATATATLVPSITGTDAASFSIVEAGTTCGPAIQPGDGCWIELQFAQSTAGQATATLAIDAGTAAVSLPLSGNALAVPTTGLSASEATIDFGDIEHGTLETAQVIVTNNSASTISMTTRSVAAPFGESDNCPSTLTPNGSCTITVTLPATTAPGLASGTLAITSGAPELDLPIQAIVLRKVRVALTGSGSGSVASLPTGIACGSTCTGDFPSGVDVTLTATGTAGSVAAGWSGACSSTTASCTIVSPADGLATAEILPSNAHKISIAMAGTGHGFAVVTGSTGQPTCISSCTVYVADASEITVYGFSPSTFVGFTGDCTTSTNTCNLGTITADRSITLTANADPNEVATLLPTAQITGLAVEPNGDLVVATATGVSRVTIAGTSVWTTPMTGGASQLAVDSNSDVYGLGSDDVFGLGSDGSQAWTRAFMGVNPGAESFDSSVAVKSDGTVVAILTGDGVHVVSGAGSDIYTITGLSPAPQTVAIGSDGTVGLIQLDESMESNQTKALRYDTTGASLATFGLLPGDEDSSIALDGTGAVCIVSTGEDELTTSRSTAPSTPAWSVTKQVNSGSTTPAGVLVDSTGEVVQVNWLSETSFGMELKVFASANGNVVIDQTKPAHALVLLSFSDVVTPQFIATGGTNRIAIAGTYDSQPWIQVYDLP
ncbi:MAG TPA: choice-of-anchor D domain-containing protein [Kofleriaceae bacterium]